MQDYYEPKIGDMAPDFRLPSTRGKEVGQTTWFASYAPFEDPRYVVVVMVEEGEWGGTTCAPVARKIYEALLASERRNSLPAAVAQYP